MWKPTGGKFANLERVLNDGIHAGKPIYMHFSDAEGLRRIMEDLKITDARRNETRQDSTKGIYLCSSSCTFNPDNVVSLIFIGNEFYRNRGKYVVVFAFQPKKSLITQPVSHGSWVQELIHTDGDITFTTGDLVYAGPNPFVDVFSQAEHPITG